MGSKTTPLVLVMFALVGALSAGAVPAAIAQEDTSLGQDLAGGIVSDVLDGSVNDDDQNGDADDEINQDATVTATVNRNQEQNGNEDNVDEFADDTISLTAEQHPGNAGVPIGLSIDTAEEETPTPPPADTADTQQTQSIKFAGEPSLKLNEPFDDRGLTTSASITASGTVTGSGGTAVLTSNVSILAICEDDETGELSNPQSFQSTVSSEPITIEPGRQSFELTTETITEPVGDVECEEGQTAILNSVQFIEPVLTIQTGGNTLTQPFPSITP